MRTLLTIITLLKFTFGGMVDAGSKMGNYKMIDSLNKFSMAFYNQLSNAQNRNVFFSPYSLFYSLTLIYTGAQGLTKQQMGRALFIKEITAIEDEFSKMALPNKTKNYVLSSHTAFWFRKEIQIKDEFKQFIKSIGIYEQHLDFAQKEYCLHSINAWVQERTQGKITNFIKKEFINADARFILTNAIYFKALWEHRFRKELTFPEIFHGIHGKLKKEMMHDTEYFSFARINGVQILKLYFKSKKASVLFFLPEATRDLQLKTVKKLLANMPLPEIESRLTMRKVQLQLPKMHIAMEIEAEDYLKKMGMEMPFLNEADFNKIADEPLKISQVLQKSFLNLNEDGCEAAAASAVVVAAGARPFPEKIETFICDHPFAFVIKDETTNMILFMGELKE